MLKSKDSVANENEALSDFTVEELLPELKLHQIDPKKLKFNLKTNKGILIFLLQNLYQSDDKNGKLWET